MFQMFRADFTLTKRHLGLILMAAGLVMIVVMIVAEWLTRSGGFGTAQKLGTLLGVTSFVVGLTLLPLGNQPA
jgi:Ca2+/Na+ antiporter